MPKLSKYFRVAVAGDTCDGRKISESEIKQMADTFDPRVYGCRINLEHRRGLFPDGDFCRLGDVTDLKWEKIVDDSALNGKVALMAQISPTDGLISMIGKKQKIYTSIEIAPNFANTGKAYLVGLAVTDDPASLGTEMLAFSATAEHSPLANRKKSPENLFSVATEAEISFDDIAEPAPSVLARVKELFAAKKKNDSDQFGDVNAAVTVVAEQVQANFDDTAQKFAALNDRLAELETSAGTDRNAVQKLTRKLEKTDGSFSRRPLANGSDGKAEIVTDC